MTLSAHPLIAANTPQADIAKLPEAPRKFNSPEEYKAYVTQLRGHLDKAKRDLVAKKQALAAEQARMTEAEGELGKPLNAAQAILRETRGAYQQPIDRISNERSVADQALQDAVYPGRRTAERLDREASQVSGSVRQLQNAVVDARNRIAAIEVRLQMAMNQRALAYADLNEADARIQDLERHAPTSGDLSSQRARVDETAERLASAQNRLSKAKDSKTQKQKVEAEITRLTSARDTWGTATVERSAAKSALDAGQVDLVQAQAALDRAIALPESDPSKSQKVVDARSRLAAAKTKHEDATKQLKKIEDRLSGLGSVAEIKSKLESLQSQLPQYSDAEKEYASAQDSVKALSQNHEAAKRELDEMRTIDDDRSRNVRRARDARDSIAYQNAVIHDASADRDLAARKVAELQVQLDHQTAQLNRTISQAEKARRQKNPADHPQVVAAKNRVDALQAELNQAKSTYNAKVGEPQNKVDQASRIYNTKMTPFRTKVEGATRQADMAEAAVNNVSGKLQQAKNSVGGPTKLWWRVRHQFDIDKF
jgi:chromosome segregation ATPase